MLRNEPGLSHRVSRKSRKTSSRAGLGADRLDLIGCHQVRRGFFAGQRAARAESVEMGERIVELQRVGEEKGNYHSRFTDALEVLRGRPDAAEMFGPTRPQRGEFVAHGGPPGRQHPHSIGIT